MIDFENIKEDIVDRLVLPYVFYMQETIGQKVVLARYILSVDNDVLLIPSCYLFSYDAIIAGLDEKKIEYISKNAPVEYKKELLNSISSDYRMKEVFEIARMMDEDLGEGVTQNQKRVKNVYQYILDNIAVFQF